ncbi:cyclin-dependent kinase inhibitor 5-like [Cynara cardunculus var. scolymus]|nr:cyclin-dependent kinase inhibitor 5-like [Cynara cardunculus var. scolymus]XP_024984919.1 cyclin-dependent kinase inhibitor 5-like [Cynara cardunculus var. scolymus]
MGKYMRRKSKTTGEVSSMEVPSLGGVLTRAKTLALQRAAAAVATAGAGSYIQLRSRRLVKPNSQKKPKENCTPTTNPNKSSSRMKVNSVDSCGSVEKLVDKEEENRQGIEIKGNLELAIDDEEASFGENMLEFEGRGRSTRETTPCNLIGDPDAIRTPGSSTKPTKSNDGKRRVQNTTSRHIPSTSEMDEFFTGPEKQQQRLFIEKYNFDPVKEKPLRGRYEWVKVDGTKKS